MDVAPFLKDSRTFVPIRFVAEGMGYNVDWDELTKTVSIYGRRKYFDTMDDAAYDWAMHFNAMSIAIFKEMGGVIYKNDKGYYWEGVKIGKDKQVNWGANEVHRGALRSMTVLFYISNEGISILENLGNIGIKYPQKLKDILEQLEDKDEHKNDTESDNK